MNDLSVKVRYRRELLLLIPAISAIFLITDYNVFFASSAQAQRQSQSAATVCNNGSCFTTLCTNDQPCQTFSSNQPSFVQPSQEATTTATMRPIEETPIMQSTEEATVMQPTDEMTEQPIEVPVEVCDDDKVDEECGADTFSSAPPVQGQLKSDDLIEGGEDHKQQLSNNGLEQSSKEDEEHSDDESNKVSEEKEDEGQE